MSRTVYVNARIITMDPNLPRADSMAVDGERVQWVGREEELPPDYAGVGKQAVGRSGPESATRRVDLRGRTVVPGFNDNHLHAIILGDHVDVPSLAGKDAKQIVDAMREHYQSATPGELLIGYEWDYPACPDPHRAILDAAFPHNPVVLAQYGGHGQWLNSEALRRIGVTRDTTDPPGGSILKDDAGEPTGVLREYRNPLIESHFGAMFRRKSLREPRLRAALDHFRRLGITSVQDNTWYVEPVRSLCRMRRRRSLTARFSCWSDGRVPGRLPHMALAGYDDHWVRRGPWKYFLDGSFTTRTAWLTEPYADETDTTGYGMSKDNILPILARLAARRRQGAFHAIGDRAIHEFLNAVEALYSTRPDARDLRFRIEHGQLIRRDDIPRLSELGVLVAAQPSALGTPEKDAALLGRERAQRAYPYRSLLDAGVHLSFGSDIPGEFTCDPLAEIELAVRRDTPEQISVEEALRCYTVESAYAEFQEREKGRLAPGYLADFAVISDDITAFNAAEISEGRVRSTRVEVTVVGGEMVYERDE